VLLGLLVFIGAGLVAFSKLNIEAYPNPAPVILEITAQALGLSAEEMERYYTVPMEVGLYITPGVDNVPLDILLRLSFVRVVVGGMLIGPISAYCSPGLADLLP
jgi:heavy metal efflux system protein